MKYLLTVTVLCVIFGCSDHSVGIPDTRQEDKMAFEKFESKETLLPMAEGNWWKFSNGSLLQKWWIAGDTIVNGNRYAVLNISGDGYEASGGFYRVADNGTVYKLDLNGGEIAFHPYKQNRTYLHGNDSISVKNLAAVETPAGIFTDCLEFTISPAPVINENGELTRIADADYTLTFKSGTGFIAAGNDGIAPLKLVEYSVVAATRHDEDLMQRYPVRFDLQSGYNHTPVTLSIDDAVAFQGVLTTSYTLGVAGSACINLSGGVHHLHCMAGGTVADTGFSVSDSLVIGVKYGTASGIAFTVYTPGNFPAYD
jgi:hypothetical protein